MLTHLVSMGLVHHIWMSNVHSKTYVEKWKPQLIGESLVSLSGVKEYTEVMLKLSSDDKNTGLVRIDANDVLYIVKTNNETIYLEDVLWGKKNNKKDMFSDFKEWCDTFGFVVCPNLKDSIDKEIWIQTL